MVEWTDSNRGHYKRAGYVLPGRFAKKGKEDEISEIELMDYLDGIERELQEERNWVREVMNYALIHIGSRRGILNRRGIEVAKKIGKVNVDYGEASCKVPDAFENLSSDKLKLRLI